MLPCLHWAAGNQLRQFDFDGFFVLNGVFTPEECAEMGAEFDRLWAIDGDDAGVEVVLEGEDGEFHEPQEGRATGIKTGSTRISNIFNKSRVFDRCLCIGPLLAASAHLLGEIKLHVIGSEGALVISEAWPEVRVYYRGQPALAFPNVRVASDNDYLIMENFVRAIDTDGDTILNARGSRAIVATVEAALESGRTGLPVEVA